MANYGPGETIKKGWIVIHEPGRIPDLKRPPQQSDDGLDTFLEALTKHYPTSKFTVCRLTWNDDLWIEDGAGRLAENAAMASLTPEDWAEIDRMHGEDDSPGEEDEEAPTDALHIAGAAHG